MNLLRKPHSRTRRDWKWAAARVLGYPLLAGLAVVVYVGFAQPEMISGEYRDGIQIVTETAR
ncbi:hypothetical protein [Prauserella cavernicola]|uniref:Uncharacterized protein n=1 Tax=Prauserella cavernicola TaxID=2800127 RepID=A0A934V600_9PSEU|nr:hypothetical protein [Prauserella cavernicola]MBK1785158.1 hypothetical protein [Prauserella cavernicola]